MKNLLLAPMYSIPPEFEHRRVIFLAGPIRGGGNWQTEASRILWERDPNCIIADPGARIDEREPDEFCYHCGIRIQGRYESQSAWESEHMSLAAQANEEGGGLYFWFGNESVEHPRASQSGPYGQDTRVEVGIWLERMRHIPNLKVHFGAQQPSTFRGLKFIHYYIRESGLSLRFFSDIREFIQSV